MLHTDRGDLRSRTVIVAGGHGAFEPKRLPVSDIDMAPWEGRGAHYLVGEKKAFPDKRVVIVGGGDSRVRLGREPGRHGRGDHARAPARGLPRPRGDGGRGDGATSTPGASSSRVPYVIKDVAGNGAIEAVELHHAENGERPNASSATRCCCSSAS